MLKTKKSKLDNYSGNYRGKVLDNDDPSKLGRIKVNVHGVFDGIDSSDLPWAVPAMPLFVGSGSDKGSFCVPDVDTYVWCFFESNDLYQPVYFASAPTGVHGLPSERTTNYPNRRVLKTGAGIVVYIDDVGEEIKVSLPSGSSITMDSSGGITLEGSGDVIIQGTTVNINP